MKAKESQTKSNRILTPFISDKQLNSATTASFVVQLLSEVS